LVTRPRKQNYEDKSNQTSRKKHKFFQIRQQTTAHPTKIQNPQPVFTVITSYSNTTVSLKGDFDIAMDENKQGKPPATNGNVDKTTKKNRKRRHRRIQNKSNTSRNNGGSLNSIKKTSKKTKSVDQNPQENESDSLSIEMITTLNWERPYRPVSIKAEERLLPLLLRYAEKERGMMRSHHYRRLESIRDACRENHITLDQALSLRRTHMMLLNPHITNTSPLHLGRTEDVRQSASLFENSIAQYLTRQGICFFTEEEQKSMVEEGQKTPPTPDFLLKDPVRLTCHESSCPIKWIEAKMFYGASTIPDGSKNAVGALLRTVRRYIEAHGPGAFIFCFGIGIRIKNLLEAEGAVVLDAKPLDLSEMRDHQRTWCANDRGQILP